MLLVRGQHIKIPKVYKMWFCPGGGGNWVNYLIWSWRNNKIIPGDHWHFSIPILQAADSTYKLVVNTLDHSILPPENSTDIMFGTTRAWNNLWYMNIVKNTAPNDSLQYHFSDTNLRFNLEWADIVEDPENFLQSLNSIINENIKFNSIVEQVWMQYLKSSYMPGVRGLEYLDNPMFDKMLDNIYNTQTDIKNSTRVRFQQTRDIFDSQWIKCDPRTWAC